MSTEIISTDEQTRVAELTGCMDASQRLDQLSRLIEELEEADSMDANRETELLDAKVDSSQVAPSLPQQAASNDSDARHRIDQLSHILATQEDPNRNQRTIAVMPAYNAAATLKQTVADIPVDAVDEIVLVDDCSSDDTVQIATELGLRVLTHKENLGYGANQKTCYKAALELDADYIVMIHPDYQYDSRVIDIAVKTIKLGICDIVVGSRIRTRRETLDGGMPLYKYIANRGLTIVENIVLGQNLGDFHSGFRVYRREVLETIPFHRNSDDFVFDSQFLAQAVQFGFKIGDIPIPVRYFAEASSINFRRSLKYGLSTLVVLAAYCAHQLEFCHVRLFDADDD